MYVQLSPLLSLLSVCVCVWLVFMSVFVNQVVHSDSTVTLIHDSPPAVREYFTPFPISARPELCCYRNIDSSKLNIADFLSPTWHKKLTWNSLWAFSFSLGSHTSEQFVSEEPCARCLKLLLRKRFVLKLPTKKLSSSKRKCWLTAVGFIPFIRSVHLVLSVFN